MAANGLTLTNDGQLLFGSTGGEVVVVHALTGKVIGYASTMDEVNDHLQLQGERRLDKCHTINFNNVGVGYDLATGMDRIYITLTHATVVKPALAGGVNSELTDAINGFMVTLNWDPGRRTLSFAWADEVQTEDGVDLPVSEASPTIHYKTGVVWAAFNQFKADPGQKTEAQLLAWLPEGGEPIAQSNILGKTVASPPLIPANPEAGQPCDHLLIGGGTPLGQWLPANVLHIFRYCEGQPDPLVLLNEQQIEGDNPLAHSPILTTNVYAGPDGAAFMLGWDAREPSGKVAFLNMDISSFIRGDPNPEIRVVDRVDLSSAVSCNNMTYNHETKRFWASFSCSLANFVGDGYTLDTLLRDDRFGVYVIEEDPDDTVGPDGLCGNRTN